MATLVFSALGTLFGGPLGGALGALAGRQIDAAIIGSPSREGPRLKDLAVSTSSYGTPIPLHFGRMRTAGSIIWATDLVEHSERTGGGKGKPSVTAYSYSASFAVALSSRPIKSVGRIWADGNLLRGAAGDLKPNGQFRLYTGEHDQQVDPLIMVAEGEEICPAFRGLAYVVFEDLDLSDFFNRIPTLTFEVIAEEGEIHFQDLLNPAISDALSLATLADIAGFSQESSLADALTILAPAVPVDCDVSGDVLTITPVRTSGPMVAIGEAATTAGQQGFSPQSGLARKRVPPPASPPEILRYYDVDRDYQPGLQRTPGRPRAGNPQSIDLPAAMSSVSARIVADRMARRNSWRGETIAWRTAELDTALTPGSLVSLPASTAVWRVTEWEWNDSGVELMLERIPGGNALTADLSSDPGRLNAPNDMAATPTLLAAFELPWDGSGSGQSPLLYAAVSSAGPGWSGSALFADHGDGQLQSLGPSGRQRAVLGLAETSLPAASPHLIDRHTAVTIRIEAPDLILSDASPEQLAQGANRALLGSEIIQFGRAIPLGAGTWRLEALWRGRGGTEQAVSSHVAGERFILLNDALVALDASAVGNNPATAIAALGRADNEPVTSPIALRGIATRPFSPVHPRMVTTTSGGLHLFWTRRARGTWMWQDHVETPLHEQTESYQVSYGPVDAPLAYWDVAVPHLTLSAQTLADLVALSPGQPLHVRQRGSYSLSEPTYLAALT